MKPERIRVLAIGMFDSVHFCRWLKQFSDQQIDFLLVPSSPHRKRHPMLLELIEPNQGRMAKYAMAPLSNLLSIPIWVLDRIFSKRLLGLAISLLLPNYKPHYVHGLELQNAGYGILRARDALAKSGSKVIVTNYGSDIFWFSRFEEHRSLLRRLLGMVDIYAAECERDVKLAMGLGFAGKVMKVAPNAGGYDVRELDKSWHEADDRSALIIKGYQGWVGRAKLAVDALELLRDKVSTLDIVFYSCNWSTIRAVRRLTKRTGLQITTYKKGQLQHFELLELFGRAKVYVGLSLSDGISTSMLEAMAMGAIPVQTATACCDEWFDETGVKVEDLSVEAVAEAILQGIELANDPSNRNINRETIRSKASEEYVKDAALEFYR